MLRAALNLYCKEHTTIKNLYGTSPRINESIRQQRIRFAGHSWCSKDELAEDVLLWKPTHGRKSPGRPKMTN